MPSHPFEGLVYAGPFHHPARQRRIERWEGQSPVLVHLDELATRAEEHHWPELWLHAASEDELVTLRGDHRLHRYPLEVLGARFFAHGLFYPAVCRPDRVCVLQVQLDAADVGLVGDGLGVE